MAAGTDIPIEALAARLAADTRLAGLDLGTKTIGVALSDFGLRIATPLKTIRREKFGKDAETLLKLCAAEKVGGLILGLPINMNGTEGPRAQATRAFLRNLAPLTELPVVLWDERLSTIGAERAMLEADLSRKEARGKDRRCGGGVHPARGVGSAGGAAGEALSRACPGAAQPVERIFRRCSASAVSSAVAGGSVASMSSAEATRFRPEALAR